MAAKAKLPGCKVWNAATTIVTRDTLACWRKD